MYATPAPGFGDMPPIPWGKKTGNTMVDLVWT